jgi:hypothetical protein
MKYFKLNMTPEQALSRFQKLAGTFHPDKPENATDGTEFIELKQEYDDFKIIMKHLAWIRRELNQIPIVKEKIVYVPQKPQYNTNELINGIKDIFKAAAPIVSDINKSIANTGKILRQAKKK